MMRQLLCALLLLGLTASAEESRVPFAGFELGSPRADAISTADRSFRMRRMVSSGDSTGDEWRVEKYAGHMVFDDADRTELVFWNDVLYGVRIYFFEYSRSSKATFNKLIRELSRQYGTFTDPRENTFGTETVSSLQKAGAAEHGLYLEVRRDKEKTTWICAYHKGLRDQIERQ